MANLLRIGLLSVAIAWHAPLAAFDPSAWELGIGFAALSYPDYPGADRQNTRFRPFPFISYYSRSFKLDRKSARIEVYPDDRLKLELSLGGLTLVDKDATARKDLPALDPVVELGPAVEYEVFREPYGNGQISLRLPIKQALTADLEEIDSLGWISHPSVNYRIRDYDRAGPWELQASVGLTLASDRYHRYFYSTATATPGTSLPGFDPDGGFGGWRASLSFSRHSRDFWYGGYFRVDDSSRAVFDNSPLLGQDYSVSGGLAIAWIFARSSDHE